MGSIAPEGLTFKGRHLIRWIMRIAPTEKGGSISMLLNGKPMGKPLKVRASPHTLYTESSHVADIQEYPELQIEADGMDVVTLTQFKEIEVTAEQIAKPAPIKPAPAKPAPIKPAPAKLARKPASRRPRPFRAFKPIQAAEEEKDGELPQPVLSRTVSQRSGRSSPKSAFVRTRSKAMGADQLDGFVKARRSTANQ
jgi:hypothetical protein